MNECENRDVESSSDTKQEKQGIFQRFKVENT